MWANLWTAENAKWCEFIVGIRLNHVHLLWFAGEETKSSVCLSKISEFSMNPVQNYSTLLRYWTQFAANIIEKKTTSVSQGASNTKHFFLVWTIEVGRGINFMRKHFSKIQTIRTSMHADTHTLNISHQTCQNTWSVVYSDSNKFIFMKNLKRTSP